MSVSVSLKIFQIGGNKTKQFMNKKEMFVKIKQIFIETKLENEGRKYFVFLLKIIK